ncbi:MAG: hypothetical protein ACRDYZ_07320, partial [Acidimicrobiales bacterium]
MEPDGRLVVRGLAAQLHIGTGAGGGGSGLHRPAQLHRTVAVLPDLAVEDEERASAIPVTGSSPALSRAPWLRT